jgi:small subunit ribosomal protein S10
MNLVRIARHIGNITSKLSIRQTTSLTKVEEGEPDKLYRIVELELKGHDPAVLKSFVKFATTAGNHLDIQSNTWNLRKPIHDRRTVLKSVHIYKKHRVQYETRTYFSFIQYKYLTGSTADTLLEYVERNLPEGVALKATKVELQALPEHLTSP